MALVPINAVNVSTVYVPDLEVALKFYTDILGFEKKRDMSPGVLLGLKGTPLSIYLEGGYKPEEKRAIEKSRMSICFNAEEGVKSAMTKLENAGIAIHNQYGDLNGSFAGFYFEDPAGNLLEFAGKP